MHPAERINQHATLIKGSSAALIVVAFFVIARALPMDRGVEALSGWVEQLGYWGPVVVGVIYIMAALLFVPGSALTLASGALFGLLWGTVTVSIASTTAAALAFLIARYLARDKVAQQAKTYPKFNAIDQAIGDGGWKIIALLRLSPVVPFSLSNYLYGLTAIRFWPCVLASWIAMLPGTFMYVYLGHIGREGLAAAADVQGSKGPAQWAMLMIGLLATVAVTVYVTRLARKAIKKRTQIEETTMHEPEPRARQSRFAAARANAQSESTPQTWPWGATITAVLAVLMLTTAAFAHMKRDEIRRLFGPPRITMVEAYLADIGGPSFDHSTFDELLRKHVSQDGWVDYQGLRKDSDRLDQYIDTVAQAPFDVLNRNEKLALLINAYNAFTLRLILDFDPADSIMDIPADSRWDHQRWQIGGYTWSLEQIEHEQIRPKFIEPRVHFALVCAAVGCPKLRNEAYRADRIEGQLEDQTKYAHSHNRWFRFDPDQGVVHLTKLYQWYGSDFEPVAGSVLDYAAQYATRLQQMLDAGRKPDIRWLEYDWRLNSEKNAEVTLTTGY